MSKDDEIFLSFPYDFIPRDIFFSLNVSCLFLSFSFAHGMMVCAGWQASLDGSLFMYFFGRLGSSFAFLHSGVGICHLYYLSRRYFGMN